MAARRPPCWPGSNARTTQRCIWQPWKGPLGAVARAARSTTDALEGVSQRRMGTCGASSGGGGLQEKNGSCPAQCEGSGRGLDGGWSACDVFGELLGMRKPRLCHGPRPGVALVRVAVADVSGRAARRLVVLAALPCLACCGVALAVMGRGGEPMGRRRRCKRPWRALS